MFGKRNVEKALEILERAREAKIHLGRKPACLAATALYLASGGQLLQKARQVLRRIRCWDKVEHRSPKTLPSRWWEALTGYIYACPQTPLGMMNRWLELILTSATTALVTYLAVNSMVLGLLAMTGVACIAVLLYALRLRESDLDVEVMEGENNIIVLAVKSKYGVNVRLVDYGFEVENAKGSRKRIRLGYKPQFLGKREYNGVFLFKCRKPQ
jgi:hypothetical protein